MCFESAALLLPPLSPDSRSSSHCAANLLSGLRPFTYHCEVLIELPCTSQKGMCRGQSAAWNPCWCSFSEWRPDVWPELGIMRWAVCLGSGNRVSFFGEGRLWVIGYMTRSKTFPLNPRVLTCKMKSLDQMTSEVFQILSSDVFCRWFLKCVPRICSIGISTSWDLVRNANS